MPEGDTIRKIATALGPRLVGGQVRDLRLKSSGASLLVGRRVLSVRSNGKHLFIELDCGMVVRSHLGMYGSWHHYPQGARWQKPERQASIVLDTENDVFVCFNAREVEVLSDGGFRLVDAESRLGPDLTREDMNAAVPVRRARELLAPETVLAEVLLDQRVASGIGNVYKSEVLFLAGRSPRQELGDTRDETLASLYRLAGELLRRNLGGGLRKGDRLIFSAQFAG